MPTTPANNDAPTPTSGPQAPQSQASQPQASQPQGRVVAELGRPETPEETAARKSASSKRHRENQTALNLVAALIVCLLVVVVIVFVVVRPDPEPREPIDFGAIAASIQPDYDETIVSPELPDGWWANDARIEEGADGVASWYIGIITPDEGFVALRQGIDANPTWVAAQLRNAIATDTRTVDGITWDIYDRRGSDDAGNLEYAMTSVVGGSTFVLFGTGSNDEFDTLATAVAADTKGEK